MNDDLIKREQLSALVDGEARPPHIQAALSFAESDEGQQSWGMYHLIGDVLRSPELAHHCQHDILSGVRAHMEREPVSAIGVIEGIHLPGLTKDTHKTVAAGLSQGAVQNTRPAANASVFRWKMAAGFASVAAVAAVGWGVMLAGAGGLSDGQGGAQLAQLNPNVVIASAAPVVAAPAVPSSLMSVSTSVEQGEAGLSPEAQSSTAVAVAGPNGQTVMLRDSRLDELLAAHPQYSSAPNLQMPASFLRNASFATSTRH
ncbi:sigma-E factor negative regulatory protein [Comamonas sp. Y33R10-2]|uniref:sigma-E factor negative regulatory protein n=1 Tax=Comamonas sp. Y33R10-2 TaxID=2853257 RepID=UPI001C5C9589|nr:sigma-E factor negative regulatory protein [Comamonas sp. Y33R10-2]QXZ11249.1 sigma-E factor negative regulatory protein [Comamonas sp. Y33R10-2]